jgi:hypothetical protein
VEDARVFRARDEIRIQGTFDFGGGAFDPANEDVEIRFGECTAVSQCWELSIPRANFERNRAGTGYEFGNRQTNVEIFDNGRFQIRMTGEVDLDVMDLDFVSLTMEIGARHQGVGLEFDDRGKCIGANGSGGCEEEL